MKIWAVFVVLVSILFSGCSLNKYSNSPLADSIRENPSSTSSLLESSTIIGEESVDENATMITPSSTDDELLAFASEESTQEYVIKIASLYGGNSFSSPNDINIRFLLWNCAINLLEMESTTEVEGGNGLCQVSKEVIDSYIEKYFGISQYDFVGEAWLEFDAEKGVYYFYPAGDGPTYSCSIIDTQIDDTIISYTCQLTNGYDNSQKKTIIKFSSMEDENYRYLRLLSNQVI